MTAIPTQLPRRLWRRGTDDFPAALALSSDGGRLVVANADGPLVVLDVRTGEAMRRLKGHSMGSMAVDWVEETGQLLSAGQDGCARLWDLKGGSIVATLEGGASWVERAAACPRGGLIATVAGRHLRFWSVDGLLLMESEWHPTAASVFEWDRSGEWLATGCSGFFLRWSRERSLKEGLPEDVIECGFGFTALALDPRGRWAACGSSDNGLRLIGLDGKAEDFAAGPYQSSLRRLSWSAGGRWLATPNGVSIPLFDSSRVGKPDPDTFRLIESHDARVNEVCFHPANESLVASGARNGYVHLHDAGEGSTRCRFRAGSAAVEHLLWTGEGNNLLVADEEGVVQLFSWQE